MKTITLSDLNIYDIGNTIQLYGAIYASKDKYYLLPLPGENKEDLFEFDAEVLDMTPAEWERFLNQTDLIEVVGPNKAILRKTQRQIDSVMQWKIWEQAGYRCEYCGEKKPLTVDHVICWESGGSTTTENLKSCCKRCNKIRGNMEYKEWINSDSYRKISKKITFEQNKKNHDLINQLEYLKTLNVNKIRSR